MKFTLTGAVCFRLFAIVSLLCLGRLCTGGEPACTILAGEDVSQPFRELLPDNGRGFLFLKSGEIDRILGELNLRRDELLKQNTLKRLNRTDLLVVVGDGLTYGTRKKYPSRVVIFDQAGGRRLLNRSLPENPDEARKTVAEAIGEAVRAVETPEKRRTLLFSAAGRGALPPDLPREFTQLAARLELELQYLPDTTMLRLDGSDNRPEVRPPAGSTFIRLEFTPAGGGTSDWAAALRLTDAAGRELLTRTVQGAERNDPQGILRTICDSLRMPFPEKHPDVKAEARRCYNEFFFQKRHGNPRAAMERSYTAIALDPGNVLYQTWALDTMRFELSNGASDETRFELIQEAAALMERGVGTYYFKNFSAVTIYAMLDHFDTSELPPALLGKLRRWVAQYRPRLIACLPDIELKGPPANEKELAAYASRAAMRCSPALYFDRALQLQALDKEIDQLRGYAAQYPDANLSITRFLPYPDGQERDLYRNIAERLARSPNLSQEAQGRAMLARLKYKPGMQENCRDAVAEYAGWIMEQPQERREKLCDIGNSILPSAALKQQLAELEAARLPPDDPRAARNASPARLFGLLKKQKVDALTMRTPVWAVPLAREFYLLNPAELQRWNPDYVIRPILTNWRSREDSLSGEQMSADSPLSPMAPTPQYMDQLLAAAANADGGRDGCLLRYANDTGAYTLEHWDGTRLRLRKIRTFNSNELHLADYRRYVYGGATLFCDRDMILIGTDDQIISINRHSGKMTVHTDFVKQRVHALLRHKGRIYAFLGDDFTALISFRPDGRDLRTHISTQRNGTDHPLEKAAKPYYVGGIASRGETLFFPVIAIDPKLSGFWKYDLNTGKAEKLQDFVEEKRAFLDRRTNYNFFRAGNAETDFSLTGTTWKDRRQLILYGIFVRFNPETGGIETMGWGSPEFLKPYNIRQSWGENLNFSGPFLVENGNFWCAGGENRYGMMTHLRLDAPEQSPRLLIPKVRVLLPGRTPNSVIAVHDLWMAEIRWRKTGSR